jgi:hypothetical protein
MTTMKSLLFLASFALGVSPAPAQAQIPFTFVSAATGHDNNNCNRHTPCRTFQRAHDHTLPLGEVTVLDPGEYGPVHITKAISITNDGVGEVGVLVSGGHTGITIAAGTDDSVSLRGLTLKGIGPGGSNGIIISSARHVSIQNCVIRNMAVTTFEFGFGILVKPTTSLNISISNTIASDNFQGGIIISNELSGTAGRLSASLDRVGMYNNNGDGLTVIGRFTAGEAIHVAVTNSVADHNAVGFQAGSAEGKAETNLTVTRTLSSNNVAGIRAFGTGAFLRIGQSTLMGNGFGWTAENGGAVLSYGDNNVNGNESGEPLMAVIAKK